MSAQIVNLSSAPSQTLNVALAVDTATINLNLKVSYNEMAGYWILAISDARGALILDSIPLVTGVYPAANILGQYAYLGLGSAYVINASNSAMDYPNSETLGTDFILLWGDSPV